MKAYQMASQRKEKKTKENEKSQSAINETSRKQKRSHHVMYHNECDVLESCYTCMKMY